MLTEMPGSHALSLGHEPRLGSQILIIFHICEHGQFSPQTGGQAAL